MEGDHWAEGRDFYVSAIKRTVGVETGRCIWKSALWRGSVEIQVDVNCLHEGRRRRDCGREALIGQILEDNKEILCRFLMSLFGSLTGAFVLASVVWSHGCRLFVLQCFHLNKGRELFSLLFYIRCSWGLRSPIINEHHASHWVFSIYVSMETTTVNTVLPKSTNQSYGPGWGVTHFKTLCSFYTVCWRVHNI